MTNDLSLPPFGKILRAYHEQRVRLRYPIYIHVGKNAKELCLRDLESGLIASYLPENENVMRYNWPISNQHIMLLDNGDLSELQLKKILFHLRSFKPRIIYFFSQKYPSLFLKENSNE